MNIRLELEAENKRLLAKKVKRQKERAALAASEKLKQVHKTIDKLLKTHAHLELRDLLVKAITKGAEMQRDEDSLKKWRTGQY
jgi:2'-5' RNA ligase